MNKLKKLSLVVALSCGVSNSTLAAGIPVIDVASLTQQITQVMNMVSQLQQLQQQLQTAQDQLVQAEEQIRSANGIRGLGSLINTAYDSSLNISESSILASAGLNSASANNLQGETAALFDELNQISAKGLGRSTKTLEQAIERFNKLLPLIQKVNNSPDEKDILDLQARINAEAVFLQNEQIKLSAMKAETEAEKRVMDQQITQMLINSSGELPTY